MVTDAPGASGVFVGGWVTYADAMKVEQLSVPRDVIDQHGAVSEAVACAMAGGAVARSGADVGVAVTGVAGPDGGTDEKPVGTVWIAVGQKATGQTSAVQPPALLARLPSQDRAWIRDMAARFALQAVRFTVLGVPLDQLATG
jgi:nicotinamide-nucleotide amidase